MFQSTACLKGEEWGGGDGSGQEAVVPWLWWQQSVGVLLAFVTLAKDGEHTTMHWDSSSQRKRLPQRCSYWATLNSREHSRRGIYLLVLPVEHFSSLLLVTAPYCSFRKVSLLCSPILGGSINQGTLCHQPRGGRLIQVRLTRLCWELDS